MYSVSSPLLLFSHASLLALEPNIISVFALDPKRGELFGLDCDTNFYRRASHDGSWTLISRKHYYDVKDEKTIVLATPIPENLVSVHPSDGMSAVTSSGTKWSGKLDTSRDRVERQENFWELLHITSGYWNY